MAFLGTTINVITKKLKSKHLVCLSFFLATDFFVGTRENILHIFRALDNHSAFFYVTEYVKFTIKHLQ